MRHGVMVYLIQYDKKDMYDIVTFQKDKVNHLKYSLKMSYKSVSETAVLEKKVELFFLDGIQASPKVITLRRMFMDLKNPDTDKPLIESIIPIPSCTDKCQIKFKDIDGNVITSQKLRDVLQPGSVTIWIP